MIYIIKIIFGLIIAALALVIAYHSLTYIFSGQWGWSIILLFAAVIGFVGISLIAGRKVKDIAKDLLNIPIWW
jgi:ABC-type iron transport system FetAB permease component